LLASFCLGGCGWRAKLVATGLAHATAAWRCVPYQRRLCLFRAYRRHRRLRIGSWAWRLFTVSSSVACHAGQLFLCTNTLSDPALTVFPQTTHTIAAGCCTQPLFVRAAMNHAAQRIVQDEQFVDTATSLITAKAALRTACAVQRSGAISMGSFAGLTQFSDQPLCQYAL